ncbi:MAG TPA: D-aminoacyl-tRNA deacylase [Thermoanaerobaculia bacterium]
MKILVQRVSRAAVAVEGREVSAIGAGLLVFLGLEKGDDAAVVEEGARKVATLRIFEDEAGKMNIAVGEAGGAVLVVSQFTLAADLSRGRRPGFERALPPAEAEPLYEHFARALELSGLSVGRGVFRAMMDVALVNAGPATFWIDLRPKGSGVATGTGSGPE